MTEKQKAELTQPNSTPDDLIRVAVESGADVDKLEKLMDLQQRWNADQARVAYFTAMNKVQTEIMPVIKDAENKQTSSKYAKLEAMHLAIYPIYTANGFSITYSEVDCPTEGMFRISADVFHVGGHERQYHVDLDLDCVGIKGNPNKTKIHGKGSTLSYGRRYLEGMIFSVVFCDEDNDGNGQAAAVDEVQLSELRKRIKEAGGEEARFVKWGNCASLEEFPSKLYAQAITGLKKKAAENDNA